MSLEQWSCTDLVTTMGTRPCDNNAISAARLYGMACMDALEIWEKQWLTNTVNAEFERMRVYLHETRQDAVFHFIKNLSASYQLAAIDLHETCRPSTRQTALKYHQILFRIYRLLQQGTTAELAIFFDTLNKLFDSIDSQSLDCLDRALKDATITKAS